MRVLGLVVAMVFGLSGVVWGAEQVKWEDCTVTTLPGLAPSGVDPGKAAKEGRYLGVLTCYMEGHGCAFAVDSQKGLRFDQAMGCFGTNDVVVVPFPEPVPVHVDVDVTVVVTGAPNAAFCFPPGLSKNLPGCQHLKKGK